MLQITSFVSNNMSLAGDVVYDCAYVIRDGVRKGVHDSAHVLNSHYSPNGFLNFGKAAIASMKLVRALTESSYFNHAIDNFEHQKNLLYATMFFQDLGSFLVKDPNTGFYSLQWPQGNHLDSTAKVLNAIGNFLEMVRCAMLYQLVRTPAPLTRFGHALGNVSVPTLFWGRHKLENVTVLQTLVKKPKDIFIFTSSLLNVINCIWKFAIPPNNVGRWEQFTSEDKCKVVSSIGKMVLISTGNWYGDKTWFRVADFITQWASEIKFVISVENKWDDIQRRAADGAPVI